MFVQAVVSPYWVVTQIFIHLFSLTAYLASLNFNKKKTYVLSKITIRLFEKSLKNDILSI